MSTEMEQQPTRERSIIYVITVVVLVVLAVIAVVSFFSARETQQAEEKADELIQSLEDAGAGTRYVFTALHRNEADFKQNRESGWEQGTEIAADQFVAHVLSLK